MRTFLSWLILTSFVSVTVCCARNHSGIKKEEPVFTPALPSFLFPANTYGVSTEPPKVEECPKKAVIYLDGKVMASSLIDFTSKIDLFERCGFKKYLVEINSPGGFVDDGFSIVKKMDRSNMTSTCIADGEAMSMAFYILQACKVRLMTRRTTLMVHGISSGGPSTFDERIGTDWLSNFATTNMAMCEHNAARMKMSPKELCKRIKQEGSWFMNWEEALKVGAVDRVLLSPNSRKAKKRTH